MAIYSRSFATHITATLEQFPRNTNFAVVGSCLLKKRPKRVKACGELSMEDIARTAGGRNPPCTKCFYMQQHAVSPAREYLIA
jgi:hypothetical protein